MPNQTAMELNERQQQVLEIMVGGTNDIHGIAEQMQLSLPHVRGIVRSLRENGLVEGASPNLEVTSDGQGFAGQGNQQGGNQQRGGNRQQAQGGGNQGGGNQGGGNQGGGNQRNDTRIARAREIFQQFAGQESRGETVKRFIDEIGMTQAGAGTYYQKLRGEAGMVNQNARGQANNSGGNQGGGSRAGGNQGGNRGGRAQQASSNQGNRGGNQGGSRAGGNQGGGRGGRAQGNNQQQGLNKAGNRRGMNNSTRPSAR